MKKFITTFTGKRFYPLSPRVEDICIEDIAHHLSNICRFTGACNRFYSVAEHSWRVSLACKKQHALRGLLHDATEAYLCDVSSPVKYDAAMRPYRDAESVLDRAICTRFGLPYKMDESIHIADKRMFATEARDLMHSSIPYKTEDCYVGIIAPLSVESAEMLFLARFNVLFAAIRD